jgi:hypothetical protein
LLRRRATMPPLENIAGPHCAARLPSRPQPFELMPDSAVKRDSARASGDSVLNRTPRRRAEAIGADTEKKLARAARSAQRLAQLSEAQRVGETLDLFAEDAERANLQALNTDIRQGTFEGFELPDAFMAAVQARSAAPSAGKRSSSNGQMLPEPVQASFADVLTPDEPAPSAEAAAEAAEAETAPSPATLAATLIAQDRDNTAPPLLRRRANPTPELDLARATAFSDTIDALRAVLAEQRTSAAMHARHMKTMLIIVVGAILLVVAAGVAQTAVLMRMRHDSALQQDRVAQLMLDQQATLSSLFDTDSANVRMLDTSGAHHVPSADASAIQPVSAVQPGASPVKHAHRHKKTH